MKALRLLVMGLVMLLTMGFMGQRASAQNVTLTADFANMTDGDCIFYGAGNSATTSGTFQGPGAGWEGWTWVKDGDNYVVYTGTGDEAMTFTGGANSSNSSGPIVDSPGGANWGGNWKR